MAALGGGRARVEDLLALLRFRRAASSHLRLADGSCCARCLGRPCLHVCPGGVYTWPAREERHEPAATGPVVSYENCLECGACRIVCPERNIVWSYPQGGFGVSFRYG